MTVEEFSPDGVANCTVRDVIDQWAEIKSDEIFLIDPATSDVLTYKELRERCRSLAGYLQNIKGLESGDCVAYAMVNGIDAALVILGCLYGGFVTTAINLVAGSSTINYVFEHSEARLVYAQESTRDLIEKAATANDCEIENYTSVSVKSDQEHLTLEPLSPEDRGLLMYTSGTTGVPKGVIHTHKSLLAGGSNTALAHKLSGADRALCVLPLYHINGLCVTLIGTLVAGGSLVIPTKFSVSTFWKHITDCKCTWFSVVPTQISYLLHDAGSQSNVLKANEQLRFGRSASAPLSPDVQEAFEAAFNVPIIETMGLTETAAQIFSNPMDGLRKLGSPGIAFGNEVIVGNERQVECSVGVEGEILVRGPNVMREYLKNSEGTRQALTSDGWLRTGDLGRMDEDGYFYVTGRLKELIIKGGENIAPREIDEALYSHPDVVEAAAFARDCPQYGQKVEAGVMLKEGSRITADALIAICHEKLGTFKSPDQIHFFSELPKGPSGKIQRIKIAEMTKQVA